MPCAAGQWHSLFTSTAFFPWMLSNVFSCFVDRFLWCFPLVLNLFALWSRESSTVKREDRVTRSGYHLWYWYCGLLTSPYLCVWSLLLFRELSFSHPFSGLYQTGLIVCWSPPWMHVSLAPSSPSPPMLFIHIHLFSFRILSTGTTELLTDLRKIRGSWGKQSCSLHFQFF